MCWIQYRARVPAGATLVHAPRRHQHAAYHLQVRSDLLPAPSDERTVVLSWRWAQRSRGCLYPTDVVWKWRGTGRSARRWVRAGCVWRIAAIQQRVHREERPMPTVCAVLRRGCVCWISRGGRRAGHAVAKRMHQQPWRARHPNTSRHSPGGRDDDSTNRACGTARHHHASSAVSSRRDRAEDPSTVCVRGW